MQVDWKGVFPAIVTQFNKDMEVDLKAIVNHTEVLIEAGVHGLIVLGTLGENTSLTADEKRLILKTVVDTAKGRVPVLAGVAETTTAAACVFAQDAASLGADGLMVLPAIAYRADRREVLEHFRSVARASSLPIMIYNNPVSYAVDVTPEMFVELADEPNLVAIKESSEDVRRITDLARLLGDRYRLFNGVDDLLLESYAAGAVGTVAGLVNAYPRQQMTLWHLMEKGDWEQARRWYRWFAPLLHLDAHPKLVQNIKLAMAVRGLGSEWVRPPRLPLAGSERERVISIVNSAGEGPD